MGEKKFPALVQPVHQLLVLSIPSPVAEAHEIERHGGRELEALCYVVDRAHPQYAGRLSIEAQAQLVRSAIGRSGSNIDYVLNTVRHLDEAGIHDLTRHGNIACRADGLIKAVEQLLDGAGAGQPFAEQPNRLGIRNPFAER